MSATPGSPAELDRRFYAFVIDRLTAWSADAVAAVLAYWSLIGAGHVAAGIAVVAAVGLLVRIGFAVVLGTRGTSPGLALLGLRALGDQTGRPIGVRPALVRQLVVGIATLPTFGLGVATLAWTAAMDPRGRRQGWHDRVTGSEVVDVRPVPAEPAPVEEAPRHVVNLTTMRLVPAREPEPVAAPASASSVPLPSRPPAPGPAARRDEAPRQPLGHPLVPDAPAPTEPRHAAAEPGTPVRWRVDFDSGEALVVEGLALVGRRPEPRGGEQVRHLVPLPSADMSLSKTHAQFQVAADGVLVFMDRGSTNGSVLIRRGAARPLAAGRPTTLLAGDRVRLGDREMTVVREA